MNFDSWHYWIIAAFLFFLLEVFIPGFILGSIGVGCLLGTAGALLGLPLWFNIILFVVGFYIGITMLKPLLKRMENSSNVKTNADGLIGKTGKVIETIASDSGTGWVHVDGDDWKAIALEEEIIEKGTLVEIIALESIVVTVRSLKRKAEAKIESAPAGKEQLSGTRGIIVSIGNRKEIIQHSEIGCIYSSQKITYLVNIHGKQVVVDESLERLEEMLGNHRFFRANRQYIIVPDIVKEYKTLHDGKMDVMLKSIPNLPECISVSRLKAHAFRKWIEKQLSN